MAFKIALGVAIVFSLMQLVTGHSSAEGVAENQPAKLAAMEGHYDANGPADMYLFGWVNDDAQEVTGLKTQVDYHSSLIRTLKHPSQG